jgi:hypothetical protein
MGAVAAVSLPGDLDLKGGDILPDEMQGRANVGHMGRRRRDSVFEFWITTHFVLLGGRRPPRVTTRRRYRRGNEPVLHEVHPDMCSLFAMIGFHHLRQTRTLRRTSVLSREARRRPPTRAVDDQPSVGAMRAMNASTVGPSW